MADRETVVQEGNTSEDTVEDIGYATFPDSRATDIHPGANIKVTYTAVSDHLQGNVEVYEGTTFLHQTEEQTHSDSDSSDISITYSEGEVVCCLQHSDDSDNTEGTFHMKGTRERHILKSGYLKEAEREDITQILQRKTPCSFLIYPHYTTHIVKEADIKTNTNFITDGQYSVVYVTQSLLDDMKKTHVQSTGKICDICVFTVGSPTVVLTVVEDGMDTKDDCIYYNTHLARKMTGLVRQETLNNFSVVSGVINREKFSSRVKLEDFIKKRKQEAIKLALPYSLDMDRDRWSAVLTCFMDRLSLCNADTTLLAVPLGQGSEPFQDVDFEITVEESSEEDGDTSDPSDQDSSFIWDLKRYRLKSHLPVGPPINIVLVGRLGNGKSATANTIFGQTLCDASLDPDPDKQRCRLHHGVVGGREIKLVDTVGRMDPENSRKILEEIGSAIFLCPEGFDAIVIVLRLSQIHDDEKKAIENLKRLFRDQELIRKHGIVVFTGGDKYKVDMSFQDYIQKKGDAFVKKLVKECDNRAVLFNNKKTSLYYQEESEKQVIAFVKEIDTLTHKKAFRKYKNPSFDDAYNYHQNIEESSQKQRLMFERERTEFVEKLRLEENKEKERQEKEWKARVKETEINVGLEREVMKKEMQAYIQENRSNVKTHLFLNLKQANEKMRRDWLSQFDVINKTHAAELNRLTEEDREVQSARWDELIQEEMQAMKAEVDYIVLKGMRQENDQRKGFLQSKFEDALQERKKLVDIQWKKIYKEALSVQGRTLQKQVVCENMEYEELWKKTFTAKCDAYTELFECETDMIIQKAKSEVDLQVKHLKRDSNWRQEMELLKDRMRLKWSAFYPENWNPEYTWKDDLLEERRGWEINCQVLFKRKLEQVSEDIKKYLDEERQRWEKLYIIKLQQKGRDYLEIIREEFSEPDKWRQVEQVKKVISIETTEEENIWKQLSQTKVDELCSTQEREWNNKEMDLFPDLSGTIMSDISEQTDIFREYWKRSVKYLVDETCFRFTETISESENEAEKKWLKKVADMYSGKQGQLLEIEEKFKEFWKLDDKEITLRKLIKDDDKLDKALAYWKSFERDWYNIEARERGKFEAKWNMILTQLSSERPVSEEAETSNFRDTLEKKMERLRMDHEEQWRLEKNGLCQFYLETFWQEKIKAIIERETKSCKDDFKKEIQKQNKEWREEASDFWSQKEIYWNACVETERGVLIDRFTKIIEKKMETQDENWREAALKECNILLADWKQDLPLKRESEETLWIEKLQQRRQKHEFEWEMELKILGRQWNKMITDRMEDEVKLFKMERNQDILKKRKSSEANWEETNRQLTQVITTKTLKEATWRAKNRRKERLKIIQERRQMEVEKWKINITWRRLEVEEHRLNEILTEVFEKKFADSNKCFPSTAKVIMKGGEEIEMRNLQKGQSILCSTEKGDLVYSEVFRFGHKTEGGQHIFVNIFTKMQTLHLSPNHHVIIGSKSCLERVPAKPTGTKAAADIHIGDILLVYDKDSEELHTEPVLGVSLVNESGLYAPYTLSGNIIVDSVLASCYVNRIKPSVAHRLLAPTRLYYRLTCGIRQALSSKQGK